MDGWIRCCLDCMKKLDRINCCLRIENVYMDQSRSLVVNYIFRKLYIVRTGYISNDGFI